MRTTLRLAAALVAAALLTGCGSGDSTADKAKPDDDGKETASAKESPTAGGGAKHTVTLQVSGSGATTIGYNTSSNDFSKQKLPWKKTETVELTAAEQKVGYLVTVVPGPVQDGSGMMRPASCVIKVDGKQVADNKGGEDPKGCKYLIK
ncbi:hypothetical protein AB0K68_33895 [Streptomyces sp. NPDC050698]